MFEDNQWQRLFWTWRKDLINQVKLTAASVNCKKQIIKQ